MGGASGHSTRLHPAVPCHVTQGSEGDLRVFTKQDTWYSTCNTCHITSCHCPTPRIMCASQLACPLAGKNLLSTWHCNMLNLRQNMPSRSAHSSSLSITKPPLALVYTEAQGLHHPRPSTFLSASQANLAGGRVLENRQALLADSYKSFTIFLPVLTEMKSEQRSGKALF